jgi:hypothetical protein
MTQPQISNFQFEGFTKAAQFDPLQLPDPTKLAESNIAVIRDNYNKMIQTGYETKRGTFEKLAELAPTALEAVKQVQGYRVGQMQAQVEEEFYKNENQQFEAIAEYDQGRQVANSVESQLSEVGVRISSEGANIAHQEFLQSASGHKYTMYMEKYLQSLGQQYGNFIEDQRANSEEEITLPNGSVMKVNQAFLSPQQDRVLVQHLRSQFFQDKGVQDAPFGAKAKHLYPAMKKYEATRDKEVTKQYGIDVSPSLRNDALSDLVDTRDMQTYLNRVSVTVDEKGKKLGFPGAQSALKDAVTNFAKNNDIAGDEILDAVLESPRFGNAFKSELAVAHRQARNTAFNDTYTAQKNEVKSLASQIVAAAQASRAAGKPMSVADIQQAVTMLQSMKPIGLSDSEAGIQAVVELEDTETISAVNLQGLREDALALAEIRRLTPDHKYFETTEGRNNEALFNKAKDFEKELLGGDFDRRNDILKDKVERLYGFTATIGEDEAAGDIKEVVARAQDIYKEAYLENLQTMNQDKASSEALKTTFKTVEEGSLKEGDQFFTGIEALSFPFLYGTPSQQAAQNTAMNAVRDKLLVAGQQGNLFGSIKEDPTIITEGRDLQEDLDTYNYTGQIPAYYRDLAKRVNDKVGREYVKSGAQLLMLAAVGAGMAPDNQYESLLIRNLRNTTSQGRSMLERIFRGERVNPQQYLLPDSVEARQAVTRPKFRKAVQYPQGNPYEQAAIYTVRFHEGTTGAEGGDKLFGDTGPGRYGTLTNKTVAEVHDIQMQALQDPQARFTDLRGNTSRSAAVGAGQFVNMIEAAQRMGVDVNKQLFDLPFQHKMMVFYGKEAGIDFTKKLTREEWNTVGSIWASISQKLGQSTNTADQTYQFYLDDLSRRGID